MVNQLRFTRDELLTPDDGKLWYSPRLLLDMYLTSLFEED